MIFGICYLPALWPIDTTPRLCYPNAVNLGERYQQLCLLGRSTFMESVADAALVIVPARTRMARGTREQTAGIVCRKDRGVVDEIPAAYKRIEDVMANQDDLVERLEAAGAQLRARDERGLVAVVG